MTPESRVRSDATCPRCGHDLRGTLAGWRDACPVAGTCTECGLELAWSEVLSPLRRPPAWSVEYASGPLDGVRRGLLTSLHVLAPWRLFASLRMSHPPRWRALAGWGLGWLLVALVGGILAMGYRVRSWGGSWSDTVETMLLPLAGTVKRHAYGPFVPRSLAMEVFGELGALLFFLGLVHLVSAATFACLPVSRRRAKVRWAHVWRVLAYAVPWITGSALLIFWLGHWLLGLRVRATTGTVAGVLLPIVVLAQPGIVIAWWSWATGRYLRMPHAWAVGFAVAMVGGLTGVAVVAYGADALGTVL